MTNVLFYIFIRDSLRGVLDYCQMSTGNGISIETEFFLCERKANPADAQTVVYSQKMGEYISERGKLLLGLSH